MASRIPARLTAAEGRRFALPVAGAFATLALLMWWRERPLLLMLFAAAATGFALAGLLVPSHLAPTLAAWMRMGHAISRVTTPVFMGVLYFVVLTPAGVLMRMTGRNPLRHRADAGGFWQSRSTGGAGQAPDRMEHQV